MIRTVTALFDDTDEAEAAFDTLSRRLAIQKGAIVTCGPGEKPDFGTIYLSRHQREACEAELANGGSLLIVQVEGDTAAEQAVDLLDRDSRDDDVSVSPPATKARTAAAPAPQPVARAATTPTSASEPTPLQAAPVAATAAPLPPRPAIAPGNVQGVPISTLSRKVAPVAPVAPQPEAIPEPARAHAPEPVAEPEPQVEAEERIPVVEEELRIGKRSVVRGGARVHSYMEEVPVTESVELIEERTSVERRPVNRRLTEEEIAASGLLQDRVVEVAQMREEAVVTKESFVREELVVKKTVEKRVEQVHETVRRTAVEMERLEPEMAAAGDATPRR